MSTKKHDNRHMHDKGRSMIRESSRERFMEEKKDMEHEEAHNREEVMKLLNEGYTYRETSAYRGQFTVKFQHPDTHKMQKLTFHYEPNLNAVSPLWEEEQQT